MIHSNQQFNNIIFFAHDLPGREKFFKQMSHASSCPFCGKEKDDYYRNPDEPSSLTTMEEMVNNGYQYEKERKYLEDKMALNETVNWNNSTRKVTPNMLNKLPLKWKSHGIPLFSSISHWCAPPCSLHTIINIHGLLWEATCNFMFQYEIQSNLIDALKQIGNKDAIKK